VNVLYVDHTSLVSGAQRALLDLLKGLPPTIAPTVMCPKGKLADMVTQIGVPVVDFAGTAGSLRLHPWRTAIAAGEIGLSGLAVRRVATAVKADIVHANTARAGLIAVAARRLGGPPTIVHIHDALPPSRSANLVRQAVCSGSDALITISDYTTENIARGYPQLPVHMLHNPLDIERFDPAAMTKRQARTALGIAHDVKVAGVVAQITPWKGQDTAIRALKLLDQQHPGARLLIVGETKFLEAARYDNRSYARWLYRLVRGLGLEGRVEFWGERDDVSTIVRALDVSLTPSWEEPFGRSVIEAMALETAVIATNVGGPAEYIEHGRNGLVLPPRDVRRWGVALERLLSDVGLREQLAQRGSLTARAAFNREDYVSKVLQVYDEVLGGPADRIGRTQRLQGSGDLGQPVRPGVTHRR
jgi:glycosyltransferase involved in cell wall biosynthesis